MSVLSRLAPVLLGLAAPAALALESASGVNLTASEGFGARHHGMALTYAAFGKGAEAAVNAPAAMGDINDFTFTTAHSEQFGMARFDNAALVVPWHARSTLGFGVARYAVSGVERRADAVTLPSAEPDGLFSTADWMFTGALSRRFGTPRHAFDVGGAVHLLRRELDQTGMGLRGDAMAQYTRDGSLRVGAHVRGLVPSMARWESGHAEYEPPEAVLFVATRRDIPYFYGTLQAGFETPGLLQPGARSSARLEGGRGITDPASALRTSKAGAEFTFDFGLSLRAGFDEIAPASWGSSARLGIGYDWRGILAVDYAYAAHPYLDQSHRVALRYTPSFPRFEGRSFRPRDPLPAAPGRPRPVYPSPSMPARPAPSVRPAQESPRDIPREIPDAPEVLEEELEEGEILEH